MEKFFLIGAAGFIFLSIYNYRTKKIYVNNNSNRFLLRVFTWGIVPFALFTLVRQLINGEKSFY